MAAAVRSKASPPVRSRRTPERIALDWEVSPQQYEFIESVVRHLGYGGARGGGKSWGVRAKATKNCLQYKGYRALILRRTYPELEENHIQPLLKLLDGIAKYNDAKKVFRFPNGSIIKLGYCDCDKDVKRYQGQEWDGIFFDEATHFKEDWIIKIRACNRGKNPYPKQCIYTMNPGGESHTYFKRIFIDRVFKPTEKPEDYHFIKALVTDNKALLDEDPEYLEMLLALPPKLRKAWLEGDWDIFEGQFFEEFANRPEQYATRQWTHVIPAEGFVLPKSWPIYRSFDWGYNKPFSCGWWAVDFDGVIYRIAELYGVKHLGGEVQPDQGVRWVPATVFDRIARMEKEHPLLKGRQIVAGVADPAIWNAESGESRAETAAKAGLMFTPGDHARIDGWMQCHYRLQFDEEGYPRMYVLDSCRDFIRTIPTLVYDEHDPEDLDTKGEDHAADEWRYFCMSRPVTPLIKTRDYHPAYGGDPLNQFTRRR